MHAEQKKILIHKMVETHSNFWRILSKDILETSLLLGATSGIIHPYLNVLLTPTISSNERTQAIHDARAFFTHQKLPWLWQTRPVTGDDFPDYLATQQFRCVQSCPTMVFQLHETLPKQKSSDIHIKTITHVKQFDDWILPIQDSFDCPQEITELFSRKFQEFPDCNIYHFVGYHKKRPVASSSIFCGKGAAVLYNVSTVRDLRGRGFGAAITLAGMQKAKAHGLKYCLLDATKSGFHLYKRLKFEAFADLHLLQNET